MAKGLIIGRLVATQDEVQMLELVLREVRHVMSTGEQMQINVDPFAHGSGLHLGFHYNGSGWTRELSGSFKPARKRTRRGKE